MKKELLKKFNIDNNFYVDDIFVFTNESNKYSFLLNKNGCSMIVDEELLNSKSASLGRGAVRSYHDFSIANCRSAKILLIV